MKNKRLIQTIIAVCSSVWIGAFSITANASEGYDINKDIWKFRNSSHSFGDTYMITENDGAVLKSNLSNIERRLAHDLIGKNFLGSCYGMAVTSMLSSYDLINYPSYTGNAEDLVSMSGVSEADDKPSDEILSLINYYACLQFTEEVRQYVAYSMLEQTETDRLQQIITNVEAGIPTLVGYFGSVSNTEERYGHAVVAYDVEYGPFQVNYIEEVDQMAMIKTASYDGRISVYDCNHYTNENSYIYFNYDGSWRADRCASENGGNINIVISDIDLLNNKGLLKGTESYVDDRNFMALLTVKSLQSDKTVQRITFDNGSWSEVSSASGQINEFYTFLGDTPQINSNMYVLKDADSGYVVSTKEMGTISAQMNYQNRLLTADVNAGNQIVFDPSGYIEAKGESSPFTLELTLNDGYHSGNWYDLVVTGTADDVSLMQTDAGYVLKSDTLSEFQITANDGEWVRERNYDLASLGSVLIFENDDKSIGLAVDLDQNGTYETILHDSASGDVNNDGVLNISDVVLFQKWLLAVPDVRLSNWESADMNNDNQLNAFDLCLLKKTLLLMKNTEPPVFEEEKEVLHKVLHIDVDEKYDNIAVTALQESYSSETSEIVCELKNQNVGKGFYYFPIPFLEKYEDGNWTEIYNGDPAAKYQYGDGYALCGYADHVADDKEFSTQLKIETKNLSPDLHAGRYRFKIYTAKSIVYAEFDVIDSEQ